MNKNNLCARLALGALGGLAGTLVIQLARQANQKALPETSPPMNQDPGEFMVQKAEQLLPARTRRRIPEKAEVVAAKFLAVGYGMTFGAMFGSARRRSGNILLEGALLGLASWAAGFLGWLPATGLVPPVWKQKPKQIFMPVAEHALFGVATVAGYKFLQEKLAA